jgi:aspartate carbamoyltransferase regulatory subunit
MHMQDKKLEVSAIENGTVIDHIPANALFKVISILNLAKIDRRSPLEQISTARNWVKRP